MAAPPKAEPSPAVRCAAPQIGSVETAVLAECAPYAADRPGLVETAQTLAVIHRGGRRVDTPKSGNGRAVVMRSGRTILTISSVGSQFTATAGFAKALAIASMAGA